MAVVAVSSGIAENVVACSTDQVKSLERRLEVSEAQAAEAKRVAAEELAGRISAHERDRVALKAAASRAEEGEWVGVRTTPVTTYFVRTYTSRNLNLHKESTLVLAFVGVGLLVVFRREKRTGKTPRKLGESVVQWGCRLLRRH